VRLHLLGTVTGLNNAFHMVAKVGLGRPEQLAGGIEEAIITTIGAGTPSRSPEPSAANPVFPSDSWP